MAYENDILTRNDNDELAVRTVQSVGDNPASSYDDIYTRDNNGKLAVRVVGSGGGDSHNKGYFATQAALEEAYPTAEAGDYAIVGSTDTVWIWDEDNSEWVDTDTKGEVVSVNGKTGTVVLNADDVGAVPQYSSMPEPNQAGDIVQYIGTTNQNYTNGYFYKSGVSGTEIVDGNTTVISFDGGDDNGDLPAPTPITFNLTTFNSYAASESQPNISGDEMSISVEIDAENNEFVDIIVLYNESENQFIVPITTNSIVGVQNALALFGIGIDLTGFTWVTYAELSLPTENTYGWERVDVQPAGNGGGIEWKTSIDLPQSVSGSPLLTIPNGLSDGTYEFYYQFKNPNTNRSYPDYFITYKIIFSLNNGVVNANVCYVIDGDYFSIEKKIESTSIMGGWFVSGNDIKIFLNAWNFVSDYRNYGISDEIKDCYKFSAIKNIETGDEYIGTGEVTSYPSTYDSSIPAYYLFAALQSEPSIPSFYDDNYFNLEETEYLCLDKFISGDVHITPGASKLYFSMFARSKGVFQATVDLNAGEYVLTVHKATGVFENTILSKSSSNYIWVEINAPAGSTGRFYVQSSGVGRDSFSVLDQAPDEQLTPLNVNQVGGNITETNFGKILQYTGVTNANYTNGYFYKANGTPVVVPTSLECTNTSTTYPGTVITCNDADDLISALMTRTGQDYDWVYTNLSFSSFDINPNTNRVYWSAWGSFTDASIVALFTFTPVPAGNITFDVQVIAQYTEIQNSSWDRVDVQPASSGGLPSQTGNSGKFLITNGTVASWGTTVEDNTLVIKNSQTSMYGGYPNQITFYSKYNGSDGTGASIQSGNNGSMVLSASSIATTGGIYPSSLVALDLGLSTQSGTWNTVYARSLGNRSSSYVIQIPEATAGVLAVQVSTMPTADSTRVGQIYQYIGATDANYTHGYFYECVSDGGSPATYSWSALNVQAGGGGSGSTATTALLDEMGWVNNSQTVNVTGVTASNNVIVAAAPASQATYSACGIICTAQGAGTLTFTCDSVPTTGITVNVLII